MTTRAAGIAPGYLFVAPVRGSLLPGAFNGTRGPLIVDDRGNPVWSHPLPAAIDAMGFRPQVYRGRPVLTWWEGGVTKRGFSVGGRDVIVDSSYRTVATVRAGDGYGTDLHEFLVTPRGTAYVTADRTVPADLSSRGGARSGRIVDTAVEEVDIRTGRVLFLWDPLQRLSLDESYAPVYPRETWDPFHVNSIDISRAGNLLISARNTSTVYYVSRRTGRIRWRLGGRRSTFRLAPGAQFAYQHDARIEPGGAISVFDNGALPQVEPQSRAVVIRLDRARRVASLARAYTHPSPPLLAPSEGNVELEPNGNALVGWGELPYLSEFGADGKLVFDAHFHGRDQTYRAFRSPWSGRPAGPPALAARATPYGTIAYASWNGATGVAAWRVLAGSSAGSLAPVATAASAGFETAIAVGGAGPLLEAQALDSGGNAIATSPLVSR